MNQEQRNSRLPGFHRLSRQQRALALAEWLQLQSDEVLDPLARGGLSPDAAEQLSENVVGIHALPFSVAPNFLVNDAEVLVPMVIEEPSVVAAAANAARIVRTGGGFQVQATAAIMICQIQLSVADPQSACATLRKHRQELLSLAAEVDPVLARLGGGPVDLELRLLPADLDDDELVVVHLLVDVRDAMGANAVNSMGEAIAPRIEALTKGRVGLRILSNLADRRMVEARCRVPIQSLALPDFPAERVRDGIVSASRFAERDPYRAATHNKGIMNGVDAVVLATGNDWRAVEAGAHAFAARDGGYRPLSTWRTEPDGALLGVLHMPMALGLVGGATQMHPNARLALKLMGATTAAHLAQVTAAVGLANNLAALRALATEGIQRGHMRLHKRSRHLAGEGDA
jgi:hydroxymethylglutaryl-CoA reductase